MPVSANRVICTKQMFCTVDRLLVLDKKDILCYYFRQGITRVALRALVVPGLVVVRKDSAHVFPHSLKVCRM